MVVYFVGLLTLATVLTARSWPFVAFAVTGLVVAFVVLPTVLAFLGVFATSVVIYTAPGGFPRPTVAAVSGPGVHHRPPDRPERVLRLHRDQADGGGQATPGTAAPPRGRRRRTPGCAQLLTQAREAGVLDERQRMAREMHDTLAQGLTGIITQLEATEQAAGRPEQWQRHADQARALARTSLSRPPVGAGPAARAAGGSQPAAGAGRSWPARWSETSAVELSFATTEAPRPLLAELEMTLFRVAQEALANVAKHLSVPGRADAVVHRPGGAAGRARRRGRLPHRAGRW